MFEFLLVVQALVTLALIMVILMQKSEGGGLGMGGSPSGFLSARGAADFLSRATAILAVAFVSLSVALAVIVSYNHSGSQVDASAASGGLPSTPAAPGAPGAAAAPLGGPAVPVGNAVPIAGGGAVPSGDPLAAAAARAANAPAGTAQPAEKGVPIQQ